MRTNFDFLTNDPQFEPFAGVAAAAEQALPISAPLCAMACRTALEFAVKWVYSVDDSLTRPYADKLVTLLSTSDFKDLIPYGMFAKLDYLRRVGNTATHNPGGVSRDQAVLALQNLHSFLDFVAYCYGVGYTEAAFDKSLLDQAPVPAAAPATPPVAEIDFQALLDQNFFKREQFTARRKAQLKRGYSARPTDMTEAETRKAYIDVMLQDAGWQRGANWVDEYPIDEMPNKSGRGAADYVLLGDDGLPLAVIEAKRTSVNVEKGRQQAVLYADFLEKKYGQRPIIFLTNGYETRIWSDRYYTERSVSGPYSKRDLEKEFNKMRSRTPLKAVRVCDTISDRYYQKEAVQAVCDALDADNRRKALLVMATGSGKTRTVISLADVLIRHRWVKNLLFLADRNALVTQAKRAFHNLMPSLSLCNLTEGKEEATARAVFSTYQTMINCIDATRDEAGRRLFTPGHDLIIVDEAHRSIYNKYKDIFTYFDALLIGLTATPKDDIGKSTYAIFDLEDRVPTYGYELLQAVRDGYLVDFVSIETALKFMTAGIAYDELSPAEQEEYENTFADEDGNLPAAIDSSALNQWIFNKDTIRKALHILMEHGQRVDYGGKIGKTIIFAKNHNHAEKIREVWDKEYPSYPGHYARVIDNYTNYAQSLIDDFSDRDKLPQIAISVDMLDTGIDIPEILNLVFFKKVLSRAKYWQMIGRGTRTCVGLIDGRDKEQFYIFDLCRNFEFFRLHPAGHEAAKTTTLQENTFNAKVDMAYKLQGIAFQTGELQTYRRELVRDLVAQIRALPRDNFAVKQHLRVIDEFQTEADFDVLTFEQTLEMAEHIAPLVLPTGDDVAAARFDMLIHQIQRALLSGTGSTRAKNDLIRRATELARYGTIPAVARQEELLTQIVYNGYLERAGVKEYEEIRVRLRDLIKFIPPHERARYDVDFTDDIVSMDWRESKVKDYADLTDYKNKVSYYIRQHQHIPAIAKLKGNRPLAPDDVRSLEDILWNELGTREQYDAQYGETPLGELVRSIVGLDQQAANEAFSCFLNDTALDSRQMHFVRQIVHYIVRNGVMKDLSVLQESPFTDQGGISELFDDETMFADLRAVIQRINRNVMPA